MAQRPDVISLITYPLHPERRICPLFAVLFLLKSLWGTGPCHCLWASVQVNKGSIDFVFIKMCDYSLSVTFGFRKLRK